LGRRVSTGGWSCADTSEWCVQRWSHGCSSTSWVTLGQPKWHIILCRTPLKPLSVGLVGLVGPEWIRMPGSGVLAHFWSVARVLSSRFTLFLVWFAKNDDLDAPALLEFTLLLSWSPKQHFPCLFACFHVVCALSLLDNSRIAHYLSPGLQPHRYHVGDMSALRSGRTLTGKCTSTCVFARQLVPFRSAPNATRSTNTLLRRPIKPRPCLC
jgi:hypothetical protein